MTIQTSHAMLMSLKIMPSSIYNTSMDINASFHLKYLKLNRVECFFFFFCFGKSAFQNETFQAVDGCGVGGLSLGTKNPSAGKVF